MILMMNLDGELLMPLDDVCAEYRAKLHKSGKIFMLAYIYFHICTIVYVHYINYLYYLCGRSSTLVQ